MDPLGYTTAIYPAGGAIGSVGLGVLPPAPRPQPPQPEGPREPTPPPHTPPGPDLLPGLSLPGHGTSDRGKPRKEGLGGTEQPGTQQPGINKAEPKGEGKGQDEEKGGKKGGRKGKGKDIKEVDDVGKKFGMDEKTRGKFGEYIEEIKHDLGRGDFTYQELIERVRDFLRGR